MEEKGKINILLLIIVVLIIIFIGYYIIYKTKLNNLIEGDSKFQNNIAVLEEENINSQNAVDMLMENNTNAIVTNNTEEDTSNSEKIDETSTVTNIYKDNVYTVDVRNEGYAIIKAIQNGKTISKEFELSGAICKAGVMDIKELGNVILVSDSAGEYLGVNVYKISNNEIKELGNIYYGADVLTSATYTTSIKNENTVVITGTSGEKTLTKEIEISEGIANVDVIDMLGYGDQVLIEKKSGEYSLYCLSIDYVTGEIQDFINSGNLQL